MISTASPDSSFFRRAAIPEEKRRPFYLYVDEFQNFMDLSIGFEQILAEARKYRLVLAGMANQYVGQLSQAVRQAIFGNVGTLLTFRLGVEDARIVAHEFGEFTPEEIMALERGQAIARVGGTQTAFNLTTFPDPPAESPDMTQEIINLSRRHYAQPRQKVEAAFHARPRPETARRSAAPAGEDQRPRSPTQPEAKVSPLPEKPLQAEAASATSPPKRFCVDDLDDMDF